MLTRALIVLLLVLNLGVATWWWLRVPAPLPAMPSQPAGVPRLQLLSEVPARLRTAPVVPPSPEPAPETATPDAEQVAEVAEPTAPRCFRIGPFADEAAANAARSALQPQAQRASVRAQRPPVRGGWNVVMPALADHAAARAMAQRLVAAGFTDNYVVASGDAANSIALGRFGSEEAARRQQTALQVAGFQAQLQAPADAAAATYWVELTAGPAFDPGPTDAAFGAARAQSVECAAQSQAG